MINRAYYQNDFTELIPFGFFQRAYGMTVYVIFCLVFTTYVIYIKNNILRKLFWIYCYVNLPIYIIGHIIGLLTLGRIIIDPIIIIKNQSVTSETIRNYAGVLDDPMKIMFLLALCSIWILGSSFKSENIKIEYEGA